MVRSLAGAVAPRGEAMVRRWDRGTLGRRGLGGERQRGAAPRAPCAGARVWPEALGGAPRPRGAGRGVVGGCRVRRGPGRVPWTPLRPGALATHASRALR